MIPLQQRLLLNWIQIILRQIYNEYPKARELSYFECYYEKKRNKALIMEKKLYKIIVFLSIGKPKKEKEKNAEQTKNWLNISQ